MSDGKDKDAIDADAIRELADLLTETSLTEIEIERKGMRLRVVRHTHHVHAAPVGAAPGPVAAAEAPKSAANGAVPSPMVGTVYVAPEPGAAPFVKVGDTVKEGDTLLIVEAMKTMNPILAPRAGIIAEICVHDAEPVEFGQALIVLN